MRGRPSVRPGHPVLEAGQREDALHGGRTADQAQPPPTVARTRQRGVWDADAFETAATVLNRGRVMSIFPEGGVHADRVPAKSGVGHIAHLAGATVVPVYLDGTRSLYEPWRWPKVRIVIGSPLRFEPNEQPSREQSQQTAQRILDAVHELAPTR